MCKKELRKKYKQLRGGLTTAERLAAEKNITKKLTELKQFKECDTIFAFISAKGEVSTEGMILKAFELGKKVAVPLVLSSEEMCFIYINSLSDLKAGSFGIQEPEYNAEKIALPTDKSVMLVPGLAYDNDLYRLGYGGGYYDRYMAKHPSPFKVGIGFQVQYSEEPLPRDKYDLPLDLFITEKTTIGV